jgi:ABC-2 type transport system ATP-binding protein
MIQATGLGKKFDNHFAVENVHFTIKPGEIIGLLGPNGAGKTTTLRMIAGILPPSKGAVTIDGIDIHTESGQLEKRKIGFLPENNPLYDEMTVEEYLDYWSEIKRIPQNERVDAIRFVVTNCGISNVYYRPISELSKGFRQRVGLSQAILTKPEILILDEPTEGLDPNQRQDIALLIRTIGKKRTIIISSHVLSEIAKIASRLIVIHNGGIVADETPEKFRQRGGKTTSIILEAKGEKIVPTIKQISGVLHVKEDTSHVYVITVEKGKDIREQVFHTAVKHKWDVLTLYRKDQDIEDIFGQLTGN